MGQGLCGLLPERIIELHRGERPLPYTLLDRLIVTALMDRLLSKGRGDVIAGMHQKIWRSPDALRYYSRLENWFKDVFLKQQIEFVSEVQKVAKAGRFQSLCDIGCGMGWLTNYLADHLIGIERFIGLDLNEHQIARNRNLYSNPKLSFVATEAVAWINQQARPGWFFFTYESLIYVPQLELEQLLSKIAKTLAPAAFAIMEVIDKNHDLAKEEPSRPFDSALHLSHNYPELFKRAGYTIQYQAERTEPADARWIWLIATAG
ncbi:MAG TPA: class I SAM-dependent methyltransferase [Chthoniobacterales bacterium]|nr:class I SAM-dependent methyltransferase [Chthoniobacterales bacterium]